MNVYDCHLHSAISFDSSEDMENYIKLAVKNKDQVFITTEHVDLESNLADQRDLVADFEKQKVKLAQMREKYPQIDILFGVEIGWREDIHHRDVELSHSQDFDMVILAVHENVKGGDAFSKLKESANVDVRYDEYLKLCYNAVCAFDNFDTFAHVDYMLRYIGHTDLRNHTEMLTKIFNKVIEKDKCLEINTKLVPHPEAMDRIDYILQLYTSLGGKKVTIGSDGHNMAFYKNGFRDAMKLMDKYGIKEVYGFKGRQPCAVPISLSGGKFYDHN